MGYWGKGGSYVALHGMPEAVFKRLRHPLPDNSNLDWNCRCGSDECWECMHLLYAAYDEAFDIEAANKLGAPSCEKYGVACERWLCSCGDWFCNDEGDHLPNADGKFNNKNPCWAGCA